MIRSSHRGRRTRRLVLPILLAGALVVSACGDDDDDDDAAGGGGAAGPAPTGAPIEIGFVNTENSPAGSYVEGRRGAEAAVAYINEELGGVNGRPLEMETCIANASPEGSIACANQFIQGDKVAVVPQLDFGAAAAMGRYADAGMPYVGGIMLSAEEYTMPTSFSFIGAAPGAVAGAAIYAARDLGAKRVAILGLDVPQTRPAVDSFMRPVLSANGATDVQVVLESPAAADFTPVLTQVAQDNPDVVINLFGGPACVKSMQAAQSVGLPQDKVVYTQECASDETIAEGGGVGAVYQSAFLSPDSDEPNVAIFREQMEAHAPDSPAGTGAQSGFNSIMNLYGVLTKLDPANITRETIVAGLRATNNEPGFLSNAYTCDGQQFPGLPALCDTTIRVLKYENDEFVDATGQWIDGVAALTGS